MNEVRMVVSVAGVSVASVIARVPCIKGVCVCYSCERGHRKLFLSRCRDHFQCVTKQSPKMSMCQVRAMIILAFVCQKRAKYPNGGFLVVDGLARCGHILCVKIL